MLNIAFRADGGKNVGLGHLMRCLSLARAFRSAGHSVSFVSKLMEGIELARSENFNVCPIPSVEQVTEGFFYGDEHSLSEEVGHVIKILTETKIDILIIDSYNVNKEYFLALKKYVKRIIYIDDINKFSYPVDIIVNGNITGEYLAYEKYTENQILLLGPNYNMIRDEFCHLPRRDLGENVNEVMITTGGADPYKITDKLLGFLLENKQLADLRLNVLVGNGFRNVEYLSNLSNTFTNVFLYANSAIAESIENVTYSEIPALMLRSDIAISAGGSTLYELAACGTPAMAFILADNQECIVTKMAELGYIKNLGWYNQLGKETVLSAFFQLINDFKQRQQMSLRGQKLIDGKGTLRIISAIIKDLEI